MSDFSESGISLLELLVVLALMSVLVGLAYPSYKNYILKAKRLEGRFALLELANRIEQHALETLEGYSDISLQKLGVSEKTEQGYYRLDIHEDKANNLVTATFELPGLSKEDVNIDIHNNVLTVSGETKTDEEKNEDGYAIRERRYGKFTRSVPIPQGVKVG